MAVRKNILNQENKDMISAQLSFEECENSFAYLDKISDTNMQLVSLICTFR